MRWFWGIVVVVVIAGAVLLLRGGKDASPAPASAPAPSPTAERASSHPQPTPASTETQHAAAPKPVPNSEPTTTPATAARTENQPATHEPPPAATPAPASTPSAPAPASVSPSNSPTPAAAPTAASPRTPVNSAPSGQTPAEPAKSATADSAKELTNALDAALGIKPETPDELAKRDEKPVAPATPAAETPKAADAAKEAPSGAKAKLVEQPDGSVLVDDKYIVRGKGTEAEPFVVSWEMLVSTQDTYQPRLGRKEIPDRVKMLNGKWVKVAGYTAFPIMAQSHDEMLVMLNQWDGCCIGVPPTPYDAIEVKLKKAAPADDRLRVSGAVKGVFRADPYLIKDWLVSLYLMDDAEFIKDDKAQTRQAGMHKGGLATPPGEDNEPIK